MPTVYTYYSRISLKVLKYIQANQYRSKDASRDYDPELIDREIDRKVEKKSKKESKKVLDEFDQWEAEKQQLKQFINLILKNKEYLSEFTLTCIVNDIQNHVVDYV